MGDSNEQVVDLTGESWDVWVFSSSEPSHSESGGRGDQGDNRFRTSLSPTLYLGEVVSCVSMFSDTCRLRGRIQAWRRCQEILRRTFPACLYQRDVVDVSRQGADQNK